MPPLVSPYLPQAASWKHLVHPTIGLLQLPALNDVLQTVKGTAEVDLPCCDIRPIAIFTYEVWERQAKVQ